MLTLTEIGGNLGERLNSGRVAALTIFSQIEKSLPHINPKARAALFAPLLPAILTACTTSAVAQPSTVEPGPYQQTLPVVKEYSPPTPTEVLVPISTPTPLPTATVEPSPTLTAALTASPTLTPSPTATPDAAASTPTASSTPEVKKEPTETITASELKPDENPQLQQALKDKFGEVQRIVQVQAVSEKKTKIEFYLVDVRNKRGNVVFQGPDQKINSFDYGIYLTADQQTGDFYVVYGDQEGRPFLSIKTSRRLTQLEGEKQEDWWARIKNMLEDPAEQRRIAKALGTPSNLRQVVVGDLVTGDVVIINADEQPEKVEGLIKGLSVQRQFEEEFKNPNEKRFEFQLIRFGQAPEHTPAPTPPAGGSPVPTARPQPTAKATEQPAATQAPAPIAKATEPPVEPTAKPIEQPKPQPPPATAKPDVATPTPDVPPATATPEPKPPEPTKPVEENIVFPGYGAKEFLGKPTIIVFDTGADGKIDQKVTTYKPDGKGNFIPTGGYIASATPEQIRFTREWDKTHPNADPNKVNGIVIDESGDYVQILLFPSNPKLPYSQWSRPWVLKKDVFNQKLDASYP